MSENILKALMQLFAIIAATSESNEDTTNKKGREVVKLFLKQQLNEEIVEQYLTIFDEFLEKQRSKKSKKRLSVDSVKVLAICSKVNNELQQHQKIPVLIKLLEYIKYNKNLTKDVMDFVKLVADTFNIPNKEFENIRALVFDLPEQIPFKENLLIISKEPIDNNIKFIYNANINGYIYVIYLESTNMCAFKYFGNEAVYLNGQLIYNDQTYILIKGSTIRGPKISPIYYSDIASAFLKTKYEQHIVFTAKNVNFRYKNSNNGVHDFNLNIESGQLVGIMGGSGTGKSTLMNVLNGNIKPNSGEVLINNYNVHTNKEKVKGLIGYVPQDDLLIEELTVYQNLYYSAKLCLAELNDKQIKELVDKTLIELDLYEIKDLKVGNPLNKFISGGQRKRLNIALELIREPEILFVDEPTSGLSSMDAEMVMDLLKEITLKGKLIFVNIHQPSSDIYKMFDKIIIIDKGGYPIYYGNPIEALIYFKKAINHVNANESECSCCGNVNSEQVLKIVETKVIDEYGRLTHIRKIKPQEWFKLYKEKIDKNFIEKKAEVSELKTNFKRPSVFNQFKIFIIRDVLAKITNKQYLLITFLEAPILAFILGYFTKYIDGEKYIFAKNENLFTYLFMCVVVSLFLGLVISAEEIIRDRKILQREKFLNLSRNAYLHAKIIIMFFISAIQTISFILIGNTILEIKGLNSEYFLILFTTSCFANMMGLNISSALNSVVTIYILIPFILVPQLLLNGVVVKYDKLHKSVANDYYVPLIGDIITARWTYEALAVVQFKDNKWEKEFFQLEKQKFFYEFKFNYVIPEIRNQIEEALMLKKNNLNIDKNIKLIRNEIEKIEKLFSKKTFENTNFINSKDFNENIANILINYLNKKNEVFINLYNKTIKQIDEKLNKLKQKYGQDGIVKLKNDYHNESVADQVLNRQSLQMYKIIDDNILQTTKPIFKDPESKIGRAHYFSPYKKIGNIKIDTKWFNVLFIWFTSLLLYIALRYDLLRKFLTSNIWNKFKKQKENED
ncbi:MAG: ATP-binding cassette domain-containing protein [Bacteroidales bacterium]|nr:ATP-binding cassette domain-containing protein [Bacteroidales bacterium]